MKRPYKEYMTFLNERDDYIRIEIACEANEPAPSESYIKDCDIALAQNSANREVLLHHAPDEWGQHCVVCQDYFDADTPEMTIAEPSYPCEIILDVTKYLDEVM